MNNKIINIIIFVLFVIAIVCGYIFASEVQTVQEEMAEYATLKNQFTSVNHAPNSDETDEPINEPDNIIPPLWAGLPYVEVYFDALLQINSNTIGWVAIPNTTISYPVVQTTNNSRYISTSFSGTHSRAGALFADMNNDMQNLDSNTIIYGHNMGTGRQDMFSSLLRYKGYDYFSNNRFIQFDTIHERHGFWKIFAVIEYDVRSTDFQFLQIRSYDDDDFMDWIEGVRERSIHDSDVAITPQCYILTLSTCDRSNYGRNGRLLVLAVKINE